MTKTTRFRSHAETAAATPRGGRNCLRVSPNTLPCDRCGSTPGVAHTPIRAAGRFCASCCPHCSPPAQTPNQRREAQR